MVTAAAPSLRQAKVACTAASRRRATQFAAATPARAQPRRAARGQLLHSAALPHRSAPALRLNEDPQGYTIDAAAPQLSAPRPSSSTFDVIGVGQSILDLGATDVPDALLAELGVAKGGRRVLGSAQERAALLTKLEASGCKLQLSAGGSLANTLVGIGRLARAQGAQLHTALACPLGADAFGAFFEAQLQEAGVTVVPQGSSTGSVLVLTSPDAQRTFVSCFPPEPLALSPSMLRSAAAVRFIIIEGYLWELPRAAETLLPLIAAAKAAGAQVVMTAGDAGVVQRHRGSMLQAMAAGVSLMFANAAEAEQLAGCAEGQGAQQAAVQLARHCPVVAVTDGCNGSYITALGELLVIPPCWLPQPPVDTTGAGDAYAAGVLYALARGHNLRTAGGFAARAASTVIGRPGAALSEAEAEQLVAQLPSDNSSSAQQEKLPGFLPAPSMQAPSAAAAASRAA